MAYLDEDDLSRLAAGGVQLQVCVQEPADAVADLVAFDVVVVLSLRAQRAGGVSRLGFDRCSGKGRRVDADGAGCRRSKAPHASLLAHAGTERE